MFELTKITLTRYSDFDEIDTYFAECFCTSCKKIHEVECDTYADAAYIEDNCTFCKLCQMYILRKNEPIVSGKEEHNTTTYENSHLFEILKNVRQSSTYVHPVPEFKPYYTSMTDALQGCIDIGVEHEYVDDKYDAIEDGMFAKISSKRHNRANKKRSTRTP